MFIKINENFYNVNNILEYHLKDDTLVLHFTNETSSLIYNIDDETKELLTKKLKYES